MATRKQIAANRRNARNSTGPRTPQGKNASRFNALKTGIDAAAQILPHESAADLAALAEDYYARFNPATPDARGLVDTLISSEWQLRRLRKAEPLLWAWAAQDCRSLFDDDDDDAPKPQPIGRILHNRAEPFARLQRRIDSAERNYLRALKELRRVQSEPEAAPDTLASEPAEPDLAASPEGGAGVSRPVPAATAIAERAERQAPSPEPLPRPILEIGFVPHAPLNRTHNNAAGL